MLTSLRHHMFGITSVLNQILSLISLFSLLLHTLNSLLVYRLCQKIGFEQVLALTIALVFALHPIQVESVAWASSMKGLLSATFALLALIYVVEQRGNIKILSLLFLLCLLSKQTLLTLPLILLMLSQDKILPSVRYFFRFSPLWVLSGLGIIVITLANRQYSHFHALDYIWQYPVRAISAMGHYFSKSLCPIKLHPEYQWNESVWLLLLGGSFIIAVVYFVIRQRCAGKYLLAFCILMAPILGWSPSPLEFAADRLLYLPLVFLLITIGYGLQRFHKSRIRYILGVLLIMTCGTLSRSQLQIWKSDAALCTHILKHAPDHFLAKINLGLIHARSGDFDQAESVLRENVIEHPDRLESLRSLSQVLLAKGEPNMAVMVVEKAQQTIAAENEYQILMATTYQQAGRKEEAIETLHKLLEKEPSNQQGQKLFEDIIQGR